MEGDTAPNVCARETLIVFDWISEKSSCFTAVGAAADTAAYHSTNQLTRTHARDSEAALTDELMYLKDKLLFIFCLTAFFFCTTSSEWCDQLSH